MVLYKHGDRLYREIEIDFRERCVEIATDLLNQPEEDLLRATQSAFESYTSGLLYIRDTHLYLVGTCFVPYIQLIPIQDKVYVKGRMPTIPTIRELGEKVFEDEMNREPRLAVAFLRAVRGEPGSDALNPRAIYQSAFKAALSRGSVELHSLKVLSLGAARAGKTALFAALQGHTLPKPEDRSVATRMQRVRLVFNHEEGFFEAVPPEEYRLASMIATSRDTTAADPGTDEGEVGAEESQGLTVVVRPPAIPGAPTTTTSAPTPLTMSAVQDLLMGELSKQHVNLDFFDFAGECEF